MVRSTLTPARYADGMGDEFDEKVSISGDPEDALRDLLMVDPEHSRIDHDERLDWIRKASAAELANPEIRAKLIQEAGKAGATPEEIDGALDERN
jgi:hypothetical protein